MKRSAELAKGGYGVLVSFVQNLRYDIVLDVDGDFLRAQIKVGRLRGGCVVFQAQSIRSNTQKSVCRNYHGDVELLIVHCPDNGRTYVIPIEDATRSQGTLRIEPTANGQRKRVRWARDYELPA
jgi:PD-(D/E)XK nuclease superfamily protein